MASRKRQWSSPISNQSTVQQLADDVEKAGILDGVDVPDDIDDYEDMLLATGLDEVAPPSGSRRRCSSVSEGGALERSGFLHKKSGALSGLRRRYFHLPPCGTLLWYKSEKDKEPTGFCHLASVTIVEHGAAGAGSRASYAQTTGGRPGFTLRGRKDYTLIADDEQERDSWLRALRHNKAFPAMAGLKGDTSGLAGSAKEPAADEKQKKKSMLQKVMMPSRLQEEMVCMAVTSDLGKKLLREYCLPEAFSLLQALRNLANRDDSLPVKSGLRFENTILRIAVKVAMLHRNGKLHSQKRVLDELESATDAACVALVRTHRALRTAQRGPPSVTIGGRVQLLCANESSPMEELLPELSLRLQCLEAILVELLAPFLPPKGIAALRDLIGHFSSPVTLQRITQGAAFQDDLDVIGGALEAIYGLIGETSLEGEGAVELRSCTRVKGATSRKFRIVVLGLPAGAMAFGVLPCCGTIVQVQVTQRARCVIFPQSQACRERCGPN